METFNAFVENSGQAGSAGEDGENTLPSPKYAARIAVYDDMSVPPRVVVVEPKDTAAYLQEIVDTVYQLMMQQGGTFPYQTIREIVENFIHAQFIEPVISILDRGMTLVFSDQGPGIPNKADAIKPSFTTATREMKRYIRGVGSGLPQVEDLMHSRGGTITIEDNLDHGTIVTISMVKHEEAQQTPVENSRSSVPPATPQTYGYGSIPVTQQQPLQWIPQQQPYVMPSTPLQPAYGYGYGYGYPQQPLYQQTPQQAPYPYQQQPQQPQQQEQPHITESHLSVLKLFAQYGRVGPRLITEQLGLPAATGSRRLKDLTALGYVYKAGQQYELTQAGSQFLATLR